MSRKYKLRLVGYESLDNIEFLIEDTLYEEQIITEDFWTGTLFITLEYFEKGELEDE